MRVGYGRWARFEAAGTDGLAATTVRLAELEALIQCRPTTPARSRRGVAAVLVAGSEKAAAHRLGLSHSTVKHHLANARSKVGATTTAQLVWILAPRLPEPEGRAQTGE